MVVFWTTEGWLRTFSTATMTKAFSFAFDLIELNGDDLRRDPLEGRKATLEMVLAKAGAGIRFNEHMEGDGPARGKPKVLVRHGRRHKG